MDAGSLTDAALITAPDERNASAPKQLKAQALPAGVLTTALWLSLWVACGSFVLAVADGLGAHPARRLLVGALFVVASAIAVWQREKVCTALRLNPVLVVPLAALQLGVCLIDGLIGGPYVAFTMTSIGLAVVVARSRTVWACVALLDVSYAVIVLIDRSPSRMVHSGDFAGVLGQLLAYPFAGLALLGLACVFKRFVGNAEPIVDAIRGGQPALTPALTHAIARPGRPVPQLPPGSVPRPALTRAEVRVVEGLASGRAPKQLAHEWQLSLTTVRSHIKHAKRKTGAKTVPELAALAARPDWPNVSRRGA